MTGSGPLGFAVLAVVVGLCVGGSGRNSSPADDLAAFRAAPAGPCRPQAGRALIPAGEVLLGEDGPGRAGRRVPVEAFFIDRHEVTNRQFAIFVAATGYVTQAERDGASAVFVRPETVDGDDAAQWWRFVRGANWRRPRAGGDTALAIADAPVVHVTYEDALAYARWAGGALPDQMQWERAARAGQLEPRSPSAWAYDDAGRPIANTWQGEFPLVQTSQDHHSGIAPVGCFAANGFGLQDMIGNVWEWTSSSAPDGARGLIKGGSFLCAFNYCANFRPAAWQAQERNLGTSHIGFRVAYPVSG